MHKAGIIGAGLMGSKRSANLLGAKLVAVADPDLPRAQKLASLYHAEASTDWRAVVKRTDLDLILICTPHDLLTPCATAALEAGKHVLVEKPGGRNPKELTQLAQAAGQSGKVLRIGFNHRFHPGFQKARSLLVQGAIGPLLYIRARYGHGGRVGYEKEWRADRERSGGGELMDQGVHLIDLCRFLGGEWTLGWGKTQTFFWPMNVEDNGFLYLESPDRKRSALLHTSWTEWKNLFDFEIFGRAGKIQICGLGGSYGTEELRIYRMRSEMGPPEIETVSYPGEDTSWQAEFDAFLHEIQGKKSDGATAQDGLQAVQIVHEAYQRCNV